MGKSHKAELLKALETLERSVDAAFTHFEQNEQLDAFDEMSDAELEQYLVSARREAPGMPESGTLLNDTGEVVHITKRYSFASLSEMLGRPTSNPEQFDGVGAWVQNTPSFSNELPLAAADGDHAANMGGFDVSQGHPEIFGTIEGIVVGGAVEKIALLDDGDTVFVDYGGTADIRVMKVFERTYDLERVSDVRFRVVNLSPADALHAYHEAADEPGHLSIQVE